MNLWPLVGAIAVFSLGWTIWAWYGHQSGQKHPNRIRIFDVAAFHVVTMAVVLACLIASFILFYMAAAWLVVAPGVLYVAMTARLRNAHRSGIARLTRQFVWGYTEAIKTGKTSIEARQAAFDAIGESHLFSAHLADSPISSNVLSLLSYRGHIPEHDVMGWRHQVTVFVNQLLVDQGLAPEPEE